MRILQCLLSIAKTGDGNALQLHMQSKINTTLHAYADKLQLLQVN